jgi:enterochelin esterase-like enzyme
MRVLRWLYGTVFVLLLSIVPIVGAQYTCGESGGRVELRTYPSTLLNQTMRYSVYLPPCYDVTTLDYPSLYLMHGSNTDNTHWLNLGLVAALDRGILQGTFAPMVVVLPYGDAIANENTFGDVSWSNVFLTELLPDVQLQYRVADNRDLRAIGGISRGGFWAFNIAMRFPERFASVGGHSAFFDLYHASDEQNPLALALSADLSALRIYLDRGKDDYAQVNLDLMSARLTERGITHTYIIHPQGEHNDAYWRAHVGEYLQFYAAEWPIPTLAVTPPAQGAVMLYLPIVAFPSLQANLTRQTLDAIATGQADANLLMGESTAAALRAYGVPLAADVRVIPDAQVVDTLWRERTSYALLPFDQLNTRVRVLNVDELHPLDHNLSTYPFAFADDTPNYDPSKLTRILLSGVTALARNVIPPLDANGVVWAGEAIQPYVTRPHFFHTSNEVSFTARCPSADVQVFGSFCSRDPHFALFPYLDVEIVELTGNHNNDYGYEAYLRTLRMFEENGIVTLGGGVNTAAARTPYLIDHHGNSVAMVACNWNGPYYALANEDASQLGGVRPGATYCEMEWLRELLPQLAAQVDVVVVTVQYAEYEQYTPIDRQINDYRALADLGADIVVGTQAHKPQTFEFYSAETGETVLLHYGMGNLFFDQPFWGNMRFFMDQLYIYDGQLLTVDLFTGIIDDNARPRPMTADERTNFLQFMFVQQNGW